MKEKQIAGEKAVDYIKDGMIVGLGTGTTVYYMIQEVGKRVKNGLNIRAVATSKNTESLANELGISLISIDIVKQIDLCIDGVDEIDKNFNAIKGGGGALFREKIVANCAKEVIWIMDSSKYVEHIGAFPLPVEILPYGYTKVLDNLQFLNFHPVLRMNENSPFITDNGNYIADLHLTNKVDMINVQHELTEMVGVLENGLFLNVCNRIIIGENGKIKIVENV